MIYKCAGCDYVFTCSMPIKGPGHPVPDRTGFSDTNYKNMYDSVKDVGLCPVCTLATILRLDDDDILHGPRVVNGRNP